MRGVSAVPLVMLAACSGSDTTPTTSGPLPAFSLWSDCAAESAIGFPDTAIGQTAHAAAIAVRVAAGAGDEQDLSATLTIDGAAAADYQVDADFSDCDDGGTLAVGGTCFVHVLFVPTDVGPRDATLHLGTTAVPLAGSGTAQATQLTADVRNAPFVRGMYGLHETYDVLLINQSSQSVTLSAPSFSTDAFAATTQCPATLTPGAACQMTVSLRRVVRGCLADTLHIASSGAALDVPVSQTFIPGVTVGGSGPAAARITSSPAGIDCALSPGEPPGGHCASAFLDPNAQVSLTVTPEAGAHFNGWTTRGCGVEPTCTVPASILDYDGPRTMYVNAQLASAEAKSLDITFAGDGLGEVLTCDATCRRWIEPATTVSLLARTPSTFGGFTGSCNAAPPSQTCDLGVVVNDRAITATFLKDDREQSTLIPDVPISLGAFTTGGDFLVAGTGRISRITSTGTVAWTTADLVDRQDTVLQLVARPAGGGYALVQHDGSTFRVIAFDAAGTLRWRTDLPYVYGIALLPAGTVVATLDDLRLLADADGSAAWTTPIADATIRSVAAAASGVIALAFYDGTVMRFDANGSRLLPDWTVPANAPQIAFDAADHLTALSSSGSSTRTLTRLDASGAVASTVTGIPVSTSFGYSGRYGLTISSTNNALLWSQYIYLLHSTYTAGGLIETYDAAGAKTWSLSKVGVPDGYGNGDSTQIGNAACDGAGRCALFGSWNQRPGWIEVFAVP